MFFKRFRKPKWQHPDPRIRKQAIVELDSRTAASQALLKQLAQEDPEADVRRSAVKAVSELAFVRSRARDDVNAGVREVAGARYRQLLTGGVEDTPLAERLDELRQCDDELVVAHVARRARESELRAAALERLEQAALLEEIAANDDSARIRQRAVERLTDPQALERLERVLRNRDKRLARSVRQRREQLRSDARREQEQRAEYSRLLVELEAHAAAEPEPGYTAALERLINRWSAVGGTPDTATSARYESVVAVCRARALEPPTQADVEPAAPAEDELSALWAELDTPQEPQPELLERVRDRLERTREDDPARGALQRWLLAAHAYLQRRSELEALLADGEIETLRELLERLPWECDRPIPPLLRAARQRVREAGQDDSAAQRHAADAYADSLRQLERALDSGELRAAQALFRQARERLQRLPEADHEEAQRELRAVQARIGELRDWRRFAILPKQRALCEQMEALAAAEDVAPAERAERIKQLRQAWQSTGGSDSAEGRQLWERFRAAAERAFEPCKAYFAELEQLRAANLAERERILAQLEAFLGQVDWEGLDGDFIARVRQQARQEWQAATPIERKASRALEQRFERHMQRLSERLRELGAQRVARRREFVQEAEALVEAELAQAVPRIKALQQEWRSLGRIASGEERRLAGAFRRAADNIFRRRDEQREAGDRRRQEELTRAYALIERAEALVAEPRPEPEPPSELHDLQRALEGLRALPGDEMQGLRGRLQEVWAQYRRQRAEQARLKQDAELNELRRRADVCARLERLEPAQDAAAASLQTEWDALPALPDTLRAPLEARWRQACERYRRGEAVDAELLASNLEARRRACVRLEILAGVDSPEADRQLRLDLQVQRLAQGLGEGVRQAPLEQARELLAAWYGAGPVDAQVAAELERRLLAVQDLVRRQSIGTEA